MSKTEMPMSAGRKLTGEGISMVPKLYDFEGDINFRPVMLDGRGIRITPDGWVFDIIRQSDFYVEGSREFYGRPIYLAKGETPAEQLTIEEYLAHSGVLVAQEKWLGQIYTGDREGVTERLAQLPEEAGVEEVARRYVKNADFLKDEAKRCRKEAKQAKRRHASAEEIEKLRWTACFHIKAAKEYQKAARLIQPIVEVVAKARARARYKAETTSRRTIAREISHREARQAQHAATQAYITVCNLLTAAASQQRAGSAPPPAGAKIFFFQTISGAVA